MGAYVATRLETISPPFNPPHASSGTESFEQAVDTHKMTTKNNPKALILIADGTEEMELYAQPTNLSSTVTDDSTAPSPTTPSCVQVYHVHLPTSLPSPPPPPLSEAVEASRSYPIRTSPTQSFLGLQ